MISICDNLKGIKHYCKTATRANQIIDDLGHESYSVDTDDKALILLREDDDSYSVDMRKVTSSMKKLQERMKK